MKRTRRKADEPRLAVGASVRVRRGVMDPDFPSVHMGDWRGTVSQVHDERPRSYLIAWHPETLERVDPACRDYCEVEDRAVDQMWLQAEDLELDSKRCVLTD